MALRLRRGTDTERQLIIPETGELIYTTDTKLVYVGDGTTAGGVPVSDGTTPPNIVEDTSPQLGGDLDLNNNDIVGVGNINITGTITATGDINLGDGTEDTVLISGLVNSNIVPQTDNNFNIGASALKWKNGYFGSVETDSLTTSLLVTETIENPNGELFYESTTQTLHTTDIILARIIGEDSTLLYDDASKILSVDTVDSNTVLTEDIRRSDQLLVYRGADNTLLVDEVIADAFTGDLVGSVFGDDSSVFFEATSSTMTVDRANIGSVISLEPQTSEPGQASTGTIAVADGLNWDPASAGPGAYPVFYDGTAWVSMIGAGGIPE